MTQALVYQFPRGSAMSAVRRILVPIKDLNSRPIPAVLKAAQVARAYGASLELFHVLTAEMYPAPLVGSQQFFATLENDARQNGIRRLEAMADRLRLHGIKVTVSAAWDFPAHEAIVRRAQTIKADLIVASQHAGKHRSLSFMRLTDWELIRLSPVPLLLVKSPHLYRRPTILAAIDPSRAHQKPESLDRDILRAASKWSTALHGTLHAVHAYTGFPITVSEGLTPGMMDSLQQDAEREARKRLTRASLPQRIARKRQHLSALRPVEAIAATATETRSAIVVMGALSRSGIKRIVIGNTAEHILDTLSCDVLILKPGAFRNRVPKKSRGVPYAAANPYPFTAF
jgi:universal stress protein E